MRPQVKLTDIIDSISLQTYNTAYYLDKESGRLVPVSKEQLLVATENRTLEDYPEWQRNQIKLVRDILADEKKEKYIAVPGKFVHHEYSTMVNFCLSFENEEMSKALCRAIIGAGAFNRFQKSIDHFGVAEEWHRYRYHAMKKVVIDWCETNDIEYEEKW